MVIKNGDLIYKFRKNIRDHLSILIWRIRLRKIGSGSVIKKGTMVIGNPRRITIGSDFKIWHRCILSVGEGLIQIGDNGLIGLNSYLNASRGNITIGNGVAIAPSCQIYSYSHHFEPGKPVIDTYKVGDVVIEDDVLIGANSIVLPGTRIGKGAIIAAGSVVNRDIEPNAVAGGIPAQFIKWRS
jgi:acetyltransferase-like isoleucine patch superfamily enzyme